MVELWLGLALAAPEGRWVWGDPHAHSAWSFDGCEDPESDCASREATPAADFFEQAAQAGLDFAALTDHAEADRLFPDGEAGEALDVWDGQRAAVQGAAGVLPILGYEWTAFRDDEKRGHPRGSHRTVLLADPEACAAYRVPGFQFDGGTYVRTYGDARYVQDTEEVADQVSELWDALDAAAETCAPSRWISFAHHPALDLPQLTDWNLAENAPDREALVEIYSEHGSSECLDVVSEGCEWRVDQDKGYVPEGSVQAALAHGYRLGFVGGTDSHDARPGSLDDGPGPAAHWDDGEVRWQFAAGGITGVWLDEAEDLNTDTLFDALEARATLASSGPRPALVAWAEGADGQDYLPGALLPRSALPARLKLEVYLEDDGDSLDAIELVGAEGELLFTGDELDLAWDAGFGDHVYARLRFLDADDQEERVWLSPWFATRRCGCASSGGGGGGVILALILWIRRYSTQVSKGPKRLHSRPSAAAAATVGRGTASGSAADGRSSVSL